MLTDPKTEVTAKQVELELNELEDYYRSRKRKLRALLAVLKDEVGKTNVRASEEQPE